MLDDIGKCVAFILQDTAEQLLKCEHAMVSRVYGMLARGRNETFEETKPWRFTTRTSLRHGAGKLALLAPSRSSAARSAGLDGKSRTATA